MNRITKLFATLSLGVLLLTGCSNITSADDQFFVDLQTMWQKRIKTIQNENNKTKGKDQEPDMHALLQKTYNVEWEDMKEYKDKDLKDGKLEKEVKDYVNTLEQINKTLDGDFNLEKNKKFNELYHKRVSLLKKINEDSRSTLPDDQIEDIQTNDKAIKEYEEFAKKQQKAAEVFQKDLNDMKLEVQKQPTEADPTVTFGGTLKNSSDMVVKNIQLAFQFDDKNDKVLDEQPVKIEVLKPGESKDFSITTAELNYDHMAIDMKDKLAIEDPNQENDKE
ncbi:MAG: FxLYD domain-containing protein [Aerococcus sp.]|nr:FxLYD domain-containing protein [Aerococcus sp.]